MKPYVIIHPLQNSSFPPVWSSASWSWQVTSLLIKFISFFVLSYARLVWFRTVKCWTLFLLLLFLLNIYFYLLIWLCQALVVAHGSSLCHTGLRLSCPEACGILVPPASIEPMSPALQGRYLATGLPGKSHQTLFSIACQRISSCTVS